MTDACVQGHTVVITDRGGLSKLYQLDDLSLVQWERTVDDKSRARVELTGRACEAQSNVLAAIEPRRHEVVIYRGAERVWEGPIVDKTLRPGSATILAADVLEYLDGRALSKYWPGPENGGPELMGDRIEEIINHELSTTYFSPGIEPSHEAVVLAWEEVDPPANVLPYLEVRPGSVLTRTETLPFEMTVYEHLKNLARGGMDFTTIGRRILIWDSAEEIGRSPMLTNADFYGDPAVHASGEDLVVVQHVIAQPDDSEEDYDPNSTDNVGSAIRGGIVPDNYYGPWTRIHTRSEDDGNAPSQEALRTQALSVSVGRWPVPTQITMGSGTSLRLSDRLTAQHLVAGTTLPVRAEVYGRTVNQDMRLQSVTFQETGSGESISASLTSWGGLTE